MVSVVNFVLQVSSTITVPRKWLRKGIITEIPTNVCFFATPACLVSTVMFVKIVFRSLKTLDSFIVINSSQKGSRGKQQLVHILVLLDSAY